MGCSGKCCAVFNFPSSPEQLRERVEKGTDGPDDAFLADMLVGLTAEEAQERALRFEVSLPEGYTLGSWAAAAPLYTCRHWDEESRLCKVYDERPKMCRDYPYIGRCQHDCGCDFVQPTEKRTELAADTVRFAVRRAERS
jgi:Fe-S-cluster containining protein